MIKKLLIHFSFVFSLTVFPLCHPAFAQTASEMDVMLAAEEVSAASLARFVLGAADLLPEDLSGFRAEEAAYQIAASRDWIKSAPGESVTYKEAAFIIMQAFDLKGGIMYTLFKNPRYAYREMIYRRLIMGHADQSMKVTGPRLLSMLDRTISYAGVNTEGRVPPQEEEDMEEEDLEETQ